MDSVCFEPSRIDFLNQDISTGTTIMAVSFDGGVVVGADSRTSAGTYIVNRVSDKLTPLDDNILCCRSGSAADTQFLADIVRHQLRLLKFQTGAPNLVRSAANIFRHYCYGYRSALSAGMIVAGYDEVQGGQIYAVPSGGMLYEAPYIIGGSGSLFLYSYFDQNYIEKMDADQCIAFVKEAITLAMTRDASSGGVARIAIVNQKGITRFDPQAIGYKHTY